MTLDVGYQQESLFGDPAPTPRQKVVERNRKVHPIAAAQYDGLWEDYPLCPTRLSKAKGNRALGREAFVKRLSEGETAATIRVRLGHLIEARELYHDLTGGHWPSLMQVSSFLGKKFERFDRPWTEADVKGYWPPPGGGQWPEEGETRMRSRAEIEAELRAAGEL